MTRDQIVDLMKAQGYTAVLDAGTTVPVDDWYPYGPLFAQIWRGGISGDSVYDDPVEMSWYRQGNDRLALALGSWKFLKTLTPFEQRRTSLDSISIQRQLKTLRAINAVHQNEQLAATIALLEGLQDLL